MAGQGKRGDVGFDWRGASRRAAPSPAPKDWRGRLQGWRRTGQGAVVGLGQVLRLVWGSSRSLTLALAVVTIVAGILPAAQAYTTKVLIDTVVRAIGLHAQHAPDRLVVGIPILWGTLRSPALSGAGAVVLLAAIGFTLQGLGALLQTLGNISQQLLQERTGQRVQLMIMEHAARLDLAFFEDPTSYDLLQQAQQATYRPLQMVSSVFSLARTTLTFLTMIALLVGISPVLALLALVAPVPSFISNWKYGWQGYAMARHTSPDRRRMAYLLQLVTTDTYAKEVKIFTLGRHLIEQFRALALAYYAQQRSLVTRRYLAGFAWGLLTTLAGSLTYVYVALQAIAGRITLGDITLYTQAANSVQSGFQGLLNGVSGLHEHHLYLSNLFELLAARPTIAAPARPLPVPRPLRGAITFDRVSFRYEHSAHNALRDVSFTIQPGETVAIVGRNGAGKTTLIKLLCRLYDAQEGRILIDGNDVRAYDPEDLRGGIGAMFQDYVTYQATARENIGYGRLERLDDTAAVADAAGRSGADAVVAKLPSGFETMLGKWFSGGVNLSGGEWQKLALARAFMRDAGILILDEPTAALDAQAEFELFQRLRALTAGRTALFISHRFSTVRLADRILVLEDGRLIEQGRHDELMALDGRYAHLFTLQAAAYVGDGSGEEVLDRMAGNGRWRRSVKEQSPG